MKRVRVKHVHPKIEGNAGSPAYLGYLAESARLAGATGDVEIDIRQWRSGSSSASHKAIGLEEVVLNARAAYPSSPIASILYAWASDLIGILKGVDEADELLIDCDLLFVHNVYAAGRLLELWPKEARERVVLMTHSPTYLALEVAAHAYEGLADDEIRDDPVQRYFVEYELNVMRSVRTVVWPCAEAQEGYPEWFDLYRQQKVRAHFATTGCTSPKIDKSAAEQRRLWDIGSDQKVAVFVGRPHFHKGFDRFVSLADCARAEDPEWVFVHVGESARTSRDLSSIRNVGFHKVQGPAYLAADLVLVPNRYSYFDFGVLQAMSIGAPLVLTPTGGHKHILRMCPFLPTFSTDDLVGSWRVLKAAAAKHTESREWAMKLQQCWDRNFRLQNMINNHLTLCKGITATDRSLEVVSAENQC